MKHTLIILLVGAVASMVALPRASAALAQGREQEGELRERDEIRRSHQLAPGTTVEVSGIRGPVEIETANVEVAEIYIVRSASSRDALGQYKVAVENNARSLIIRGEQQRRASGPGFGADVRHHVTLKLPRGVNLSIKGIGGSVRVGDVGGRLSVNSVGGSLTAGAVDGQAQIGGVSGGVEVGRVNQPMQIKSVSGNVRIGQASDSLDVSGVTGTVSAGIAKLGRDGVQIRSVSGQVELRFTSRLNAQLSTNHVSGKVSIDVPNVTIQSSPGLAAIRAMIGTGGYPISIDGVSNGVRLTQGN